MAHPSGSHCEKIYNRMSMPSGSYFFCKWQPDGMLIRFSIFSQCESDEGVIRFSFPNQNDPVLIPQIGKFLRSPSTTPQTPNQLL